MRKKRKAPKRPTKRSRTSILRTRYYRRRILADSFEKVRELIPNVGIALLLAGLTAGLEFGLKPHPDLLKAINVRALVIVVGVVVASIALFTALMMVFVVVLKKRQDAPLSITYRVKKAFEKALDESFVNPKKSQQFHEQRTH